MKATCQLVVIGAGPAGMAAAQTAAAHGVEVVVFDDQSHPGGQIYRNLENSQVEPTILGKDYAAGAQPIAAFRQADLDYRPDTAVWYLDKTRSLGLLHAGCCEQISASKIVIASGAQERPMPFSGWHKPGVMSAGAGQILLKSAAMVPADGVVLAGCGPLLLLLASQYLSAGVKIAALLETTPRGNLRRALRYVPGAIAASDYLLKGLKLTHMIRRARVPWYKSVTDLVATGDSKLQAVSFSSAGRQLAIETELMLVHQGIIPDLQMAQAAGCGIEWSPTQQSWKASRDSWGETTQTDFFVVGDSASIVGAQAARLEGQLAGLQIASQLGFLEGASRDTIARPIRAALDRHLAIRPFLDACYRLAESSLLPSDDTIVCRCEEITAAQLRQIATLGCSGPNQAKAFTRCGMGPCQGRQCAATVEQILAGKQGRARSELGRYNARPPLKPVTLGQLADL